MKNLRNKNFDPNADLVQSYLQSSWDIVVAIYNNLAALLNISDAIDAGTLKDAESKSIVIESPSNSEDLSYFFTDVAITVKAIRVVLTGTATPSVTWTIRFGPDRSLAGTEVVTGGTVTADTTTGSDITTFDDATIPADSHVWVETTDQSGNVTTMIITLFFDEDL